MFEAKKFIFLSKLQRILVSTLLGALLLGAFGLLYASMTMLIDQEIKALSIDLIKLTATAWGAWGLILLYASANSFERVAKETIAFLKSDLSRAFDAAIGHTGDVVIVPDDVGLRLNLVAQTHNSVIYEFVDLSGFSIHFYCRLNVFDLSILVFLPASHEAAHEKIYGGALNYLRDNGVKVMCMGVVESQWLPTKDKKRLQIHFSRLFSEDFLFDASKRVFVANSIYGDMRAFLVRAKRGEVLAS